MSPPRIVRVAGALVEARPMRESFLYELTKVGSRRMLGEVIRLEGDTATLQVYEDTQGLALGEPVVTTGRTLAAHLGPGLVGSILDGVGRPLRKLADASGDFISAGVPATTLDPERRWPVQAIQRPGDQVREGDIIGLVEERPTFTHAIMVPPGVAGTIAALQSGDFTVCDPIGRLEDGTPLLLAQYWPVRRSRPIAERLVGDVPFVTGQRVFDFLFPLAEGGCAAVPGGFGTGKTVIEHSLAKYGDSDVIVFVGCGERGNEMTDVLEEFPNLKDPRTGGSIMDRAVLVVNTSNMPVAAREASIYLGITIAEYFRDMGKRVSLMVDSTSRWAEALRELAARLQEMPGEEGFPTYLASRLGRFYERAGRARLLGMPERTGAVTIIGAISPPGGDFSEPVTQATLRVSGALWALDARLAHERHFPAVDWETSYSLTAETCDRWYAAHVAPDWPALRATLVTLLQRERELRDVAGLVGPDALEDRDRWAMLMAAAAREVILRQSALDPNDALSPPAKTVALARAAVRLHEAGDHAIGAGVPVGRLPHDASRKLLASIRDAPPELVEARASEAMAVASGFTALEDEVAATAAAGGVA
ncbi:MAG: V-type ATP synthase subunit A [Gemmatimonadaceae bacterium]